MSTHGSLLFNNERLSITQWLLGRTETGWLSVPLCSRCNRLITALSSPVHRLRQGLSGNVAARPSAHPPLVLISINLTQNAITVQSAPVAASWCRAVCAVMSVLLSPFIYLSFSLTFFSYLSLSKINSLTSCIFCFPIAGPYLLSRQRLHDRRGRQRWKL